MSAKAGFDDGLVFVQLYSKEIARKVMVKGIKSFKRERHKWPSA